jgi:hypothetical protein
MYFSHSHQKRVVKNKKRTRSSIHDITLGDNNSAPVPIDHNFVPFPDVGSILQQHQGVHYYYPSNSLQDQMGLFGHSNCGF